MKVSQLIMLLQQTQAQQDYDPEVVFDNVGEPRVEPPAHYEIDHVQLLDDLCVLTSDGSEG